jgi:hypothetical protein
MTGHSHPGLLLQHRDGTHPALENRRWQLCGRHDVDESLWSGPAMKEARRRMCLSTVIALEREVFYSKSIEASTVNETKHTPWR